MSVRAIVYSKPNCAKCNQTHRVLSKAMVVQMEKLFEPENTEWSNAKIEEFKAKGYRSMPVVCILDENDHCVDEWCDFQFDKIQKWTKTR